MQFNSHVAVYFTSFNLFPLLQLFILLQLYFKQIKSSNSVKRKLSENPKNILYLSYIIDIIQPLQPALQFSVKWSYASYILYQTL